MRPNSGKSELTLRASLVPVSTFYLLTSGILVRSLYTREQARSVAELTCFSHRPRIFPDHHWRYLLALISDLTFPTLRILQHVTAFPAQRGHLLCCRSLVTSLA
jgi:hypothetical protein